MQFIYTEITLSPYSAPACAKVTAMLSAIGNDSFDCSNNLIKAYIPAALFAADTLTSTLNAISLPATISHTIHHLDDKNWNETWERESFDPILEREYGIKLNPRMAFGSGSHDTTHQITTLLFN